MSVSSPKDSLKVNLQLMHADDEDCHVPDTATVLTRNLAKCVLITRERFKRNHLNAQN